MPLNIDGYSIQDRDVRMYERTNIVRSGLVLHLDASIFNTVTYGTTWFDISGNGNHSTINGTHSYANNSIRLVNDSTDKSLNISHIQCPSITNITTVMSWHYIHSTPANRYFLDSRTGMSGGYYWSGNSFPDWQGGLYINGSSVTNSWSNFERVGEWYNATLIADSPNTDDINIYSRFSDNEGLDVSSSVIMIYNRALSATEIAHNYNVTKGRFGL